MEVKVGDYLLTKENQLFRIMDVYTDTTGTYYDIKSFKRRPTYEVSTIKSVPRNYLRHLGSVIPEEKMTKAIKILYGWG